MNCYRCGEPIKKLLVACIMAEMGYGIRPLGNKEDDIGLCPRCLLCFNAFMSGAKLVDENEIVDSFIEGLGNTLDE